MSDKYLRYIHHAAFELQSAGMGIIFDPFLEGNPSGISVDDVHVQWVFVSHAHGDHLGAAFEIAKANDATVLSTAEIAGLARENGCKAHAMHLGGTHRFDFGKLRLVPAFHGSGIAGGHACGCIIDFCGIRLYFAGDTSVFGDMAMLQKLDPFDVALLPIGDNFTMGPEDAAFATELLDVPTVVPIHYNTWPLIAQDPERFKALVHERAPKTNVRILKSGEKMSF